MYRNNTRPTRSQFPTRELWEALAILFKHYFREDIGLYRFMSDHVRPPDKVVEAVRILDCWVEIAFNEGWLDGFDLEG